MAKRRYTRVRCMHTVERVPNRSGAMICPECRSDWRIHYRRKHYVRYLLEQTRLRARRLSIPFDLVDADIVIPDRCPVLGMPLVIGTRGDTEASPSLDRFIPRLGYVRGNIAVISNRANRLKSDGSLAEHDALVRWMQSVKSTQGG